MSTGTSANYLGVDPSYTCTGMALWDGSAVKLQAEVKTNPRDTAGKRLQAIYEAVLAIIRAERPVAVGVEDYAQKASYTPFMAGEVGGAVRLACAVGDVPYFDVQPALCKKFATGNGNASKERVQAALTGFTGCVPMSLDVSDALGMALVAEACVLEFSPRGRRCETEVIRTILHPKKRPPRKRIPLNL